MKRLPMIPQREFEFVAKTFCLVRDIATDGERIARAREEAEAARAASDAAQTRLFQKRRTVKKRSLKPKKALHR